MKTGDTVADFELPDQTGTPRKLSALLSDGPIVLFFYPAAMTTGGPRCNGCPAGANRTARNANLNWPGWRAGGAILVRLNEHDC